MMFRGAERIPPSAASESGGVAFHGLLVSNVRAVRVEAGGSARASLAQQVPALVQGDLESAQSLPVGVGHLPVRFALEQLVLLACQLVDSAQHLFVVHKPSCGTVTRGVVIALYDDTLTLQRRVWRRAG
jgi:hypothetical protein